MYLIRIHRSHREIPGASIVSLAGTLGTTPGNINAVFPDRSPSIGATRSWRSNAYDYIHWVAGFTSRIAIATYTGVIDGMSLLVKKNVIRPILVCTIIGWAGWNTSFVDPPMQTVKETAEDLKGVTNDAAQTVATIAHFICTVAVSTKSLLRAWAFWRILRDL